MKIVRDNSQAALKQLYTYLKEQGSDIAYEPATDPRPYDMLALKIYGEAEGKPIYWPAEVSFLPGLEEDLKETSILQCFVPLVPNLPAELNEALAGMVTRINTKLPLVGFGLLETHSLLYFKHNIMLPNDEPALNGKVVLHSLEMIAYLLFNFFEAFVEVVTGKKTVQQAMETMPMSHVYAQ